LEVESAISYLFLAAHISSQKGWLGQAFFFPWLTSKYRVVPEQFRKGSLMSYREIPEHFRTGSRKVAGEISYREIS
jgi:hypothetical protein